VERRRSWPVSVFEVDPEHLTHMTSADFALVFSMTPLASRAFAYFASWYVLGALAFWLIAMETRGRTIDQIDAELSASGKASTKEAVTT
jgi:hypothetical protein